MTHSPDFYDGAQVLRRRDPRTIEERLSEMRFEGGIAPSEEVRRRKAAIERWIDSLRAEPPILISDQTPFQYDLASNKRAKTRSIRSKDNG